MYFFLTTLSEVKLFECNLKMDKKDELYFFLCFFWGWVGGGMGVSSLQVACETVNFVLYIFVVLPIKLFGKKRSASMCPMWLSLSALLSPASSESLCAHKINADAFLLKRNQS